MIDAGVISTCSTIALAGLLFYAKTIYFNYVSDDLPALAKSKDVVLTGFWHKVYLWIIGEIRTRPDLDHLLTTLLHCGNAVLMFLVFGRNGPALIAAFLFLFNPMTNQGSVWIAGRGYSLPLFLMLLACLFPTVAPALFVGVTYFTVGYLAPVVLVGGALTGLLPAAGLLAVWVIGSWLYNKPKFLQAVSNKATQERVAEDYRWHWGKARLAVKTVGWYFINGLIPYRVAFYHNFLQSCAGNEIMRKRAYSFCRYFWIGAVVLTAFAVLTVLQLAGRSPVPGQFYWGLWWFVAGIAPFSNLRRNNQEIADRFLYIPLAGLMLMAGVVLSRWLPAVLLVAGWYAGRMWSVLPAYQDDYWIIEHSVIEDRFAWYAWHVRALKRWAAGSYKEALIFWVMARMISPKEFKLLFNLATVLRILNNIPESDQFLTLAEQAIIPGQELPSREIIENLRRGVVTLCT